MSSIGRAARLGYWKTGGIKCWDDLIINTFGRSNSASRYEGREGLDRAINELEDISVVKGKLPTMDDAKAIYSAARRRYWKEFDIMNWNELLMTKFGECNRVKYEGRDGLRLAIKKIKFYYNNKKIPYDQQAIDERMKKIRQSISNGNWFEYGIKSWEDLVTHVKDSVR